MAGPGETWQKGHRLVIAPVEPLEDNSSDVRQT